MICAGFNINSARFSLAKRLLRDVRMDPGMQYVTKWFQNSEGLSLINEWLCFVCAKAIGISPFVYGRKAIYSEFVQTNVKWRPGCKNHNAVSKIKSEAYN